MPKLCPNITFSHQQDFFPIRSVTKSSTARFSHENLVEKFKIFVQDFVPIRTALIVLIMVVIIMVVIIVIIMVIIIVIIMVIMVIIVVIVV